MTHVHRARTVEAAKHLLDEEGLCVIEGMLDAAAIERVRDALMAGVARDVASGVPVRRSCVRSGTGT